MRLTYPVPRRHGFAKGYRGRWFYQQPLSKPAFVDDPTDKSFHIFDLTGLYVMPELQPVYDSEENDFSLWIAPEFGKVLREGTIIYLKPAWNTSGRGTRSS